MGSTAPNRSVIVQPNISTGIRYPPRVRDLRDRITSHLSGTPKEQNQGGRTDGKESKGKTQPNNENIREVVVPEKVYETITEEEALLPVFGLKPTKSSRLIKPTLE